MDACPTCFAARAVLQRSCPPCIAYWTYDDPALDVFLSFQEDMDTASEPPASLIKIDIDDVQKTASVFEWQTDRMFLAEYNEALLTPSDVDIKTLATHPLFRTALLALVFPFDHDALWLDLSATGDYSDPMLEVFITFQCPMDQTVTPLPADLTIYADGVPKVPDSVVWTDADHLRLRYSEAALGAPVIDVQLPIPTDRLRCISGGVIPAFRLDSLPAP